MRRHNLSPNLGLLFADLVFHSLAAGGAVSVVAVCVGCRGSFDRRTGVGSEVTRVLQGTAAAGLGTVRADRASNRRCMIAVEQRRLHCF